MKDAAHAVRARTEMLAQAVRGSRSLASLRQSYSWRKSAMGSLAGNVISNAASSASSMLPLPSFTIFSSSVLYGGRRCIRVVFRLTGRIITANPGRLHHPTMGVDGAYVAFELRSFCTRGALTG
jgi:hypothetical protein